MPAWPGMPAGISVIARSLVAGIPDTCPPGKAGVALQAVLGEVSGI